MTAARRAALGSPFRGLAPFGESELDALLFFGRERETEIVDREPDRVAADGALRPERRREELAPPRGRRAARARARGDAPSRAAPTLAVVVFSSWATTGRALADAIAAEVAPLAADARREPPRRRARSPSVVEHWTRRPRRRALPRPRPARGVLRLPRRRPAPGRCSRELPDVVARPALRANVLLSLRDDALARLDVFKARIPNVFANSLRLDRLDRDAAARAAILGPLEQWNESVPPDERVTIEPELVDDVLDAVGGAGDGRASRRRTCSS